MEVAITETVSLTLLVTVRIGATLRLVPFFGGGPVPLVPWAALSASLGFILATSLEARGLPPLGGAMWFALAVKELAIGLVLGVLARLAFSVLEMVGELARAQTLYTPITGGGTDNQRGMPFFGLYTVLGTAVFLAMDGHHALLKGLKATLSGMNPAVFPTASFGEVGLEVVVELFTVAIGTAVLLAAPIFVAGLAVDLLLGMVARFGPGQNRAGTLTALRAVAVELAVLATLGFILVQSLEFLEQGLTKLTLGGFFAGP